MASNGEVKIKRTTIERGVRSVNGSGDDSGDFSINKTLAVAAMKQKRDHEKQTLHQLNDRFAQYIDRVKFLEGQNKKLLAELDEMRHNWGEESRIIREKYEPELAEARILIDDTTKEKAAAEIKAKRAEYEVLNFKRLYDENVYISQADRTKISNLEYLHQENQAELDILKRQIADASTDIEKYKNEIARLSEDLKRLLEDLDQETLRRIKLENEKQTLEEQIPFMNAIHEQEMAELRLLSQGSHIDPTQFYRHELERAIRDIRSDFDDLNQQQKRDLEEWFKMKTEEIVQQVAKRDALDSLTKSAESPQAYKTTLTESHKELIDLKQLNNDLAVRLSQLEEELDQKRRDNAFALDEKDRDLADLKGRLHDLMADYDELMSNKASLEFEISTYRRLLECEETRGTRNPAHIDTNNNHQRAQPPVYQQSYSPTYYQPPASQTPPSFSPRAPTINPSEMSSKTTYQRSAKGPVSISECSPDGKVIVLENTSRNKDVDLSDWLIRRRVDNRPEISFRFPQNLVLKATKTVRVWSRGNGKDNLPNEIVNWDLDSWGMGVNVHTVLSNDQGEEKATHLQKTVYS
ncbi:intermediate filament ifa-1 [Brachionus plicatilis]|uniref:Intermediate filament ifa-1 n=1 Tax=Brachionus plicatilis TaxID=10195 RepID=A0A3M7R5L9_BRAPC|nr:intermediate filament ifa-1 [Brachionus plicatilis]